MDYAIDATKSSATKTSTTLALDALVKRTADKAVRDASKSFSATLGCYAFKGDPSATTHKFEKYEDVTIDFEGATGTTAFASVVAAAVTMFMF